MNEVAFGAPFPRSFAALFQEKARSPTVVRSIALEGHKFTPKELLDLQLVDELADGGSKGVLSSAMALGKKMGKNASTGVWGLIKVSSKREHLDLDLDTVALFCSGSSTLPHWPGSPTTADRSCLSRKTT